MIDTNEAFDKIAEIHNQISKNKIYRGYKPVVVAISGVIGIIAGVVQFFLIKNISSLHFVIYWSFVAFINVAICSFMILYQYLFLESDFERKKTITVMIQFIPMIIAGVMCAFYFSFYNNEFISMLPGIWALLFCMGILNVRPYLSNLTIIPSIYYFFCSIMLFYLKFHYLNLIGIGMIITFGIGQFISAIVLYFSIERQK